MSFPKPPGFPAATPFPVFPPPESIKIEESVNLDYPHMTIGGFKVGERVRIGQSPYVFYVSSMAKTHVNLMVPGMTGRIFSVALDCVERVEE